MAKILLGILITAFVIIAITFLKTSFPPAPPTAVIKEKVTLTSPEPDATITSPLRVSGEAKGTWFFEASFPIILTDWDGRIVGESYATAQGDWMTEDHVPFTGTVQYTMPEYIGDFSKRGALILKKANPSGLPEHDDALEITVFFNNEK